MELKPGAVAEVEMVVTPDRTAEAVGVKGVTVFGTPFLVGLLEDAAARVILPHLPPGGASVGTTVDIRHLAPTPIGMKVRARAELLETDGNRFLFKVEAFDEVEKIAEGKHERFAIGSLEKFLSRAAGKGKPKA